MPLVTDGGERPTPLEIDGGERPTPLEIDGGERPTSLVTDGGGQPTPDAAAVRRAANETYLAFDLIVAVAANGVIGRAGEMPWHLPADLERFKRLTTGHPVILGRRTYESIVDQLGEPLPDRTSVVLSRSRREYPPGAVHAESVPAAIDAAARAADEHGVERAFVAGGATVYAAFLPVADRLYRTELADAYEGDTLFPDWDRDAWVETDRDERESFAFVTYERRG